MCYPASIDNDGFVKQVQLLSVSAQSSAVALGHSLSLTAPVEYGFEDSFGRRTRTWNAQLSPDSSFLAAAVLGQAPKAFHEDARFSHWSIMHTTSGGIVLTVPVITAAKGWIPSCCWSPASTHLVTNCGMLADLSTLSVRQLYIPGLADKELSGLAFDDVGRLIGCNVRFRADPDQHAADEEPPGALVVEVTSGKVVFSLPDAKFVAFSRRGHAIVQSPLVTRVKESIWSIFDLKSQASLYQLNVDRIAILEHGFCTPYRIAHRRALATPKTQAFVLNDRFVVADGFDAESSLFLGKPERNVHGTGLYQALHVGSASAWCFSADECLLATVACSENHNVRRNAHILRLAH